MLWETACSLLNRANARFLGSCSLTSSVLRRVVSRLWSVPAVGEHGPFLREAEFCASSRTTNAKRTLPILGDGGPGGKGKQTGMWSEEEPYEGQLARNPWPG